MILEKLSEKDFLESFRNVPRVALSLALFNSTGELILTKRARDPFKGSWHLPGSFLLKGEKILDCVRRILQDELAISSNQEPEFAFVSEDLEDDPRGHVIDLIYKLSLSETPVVVGDTLDVGYFKNVPQNVGFNHTDVLKKLF